jgi:hypothetical protein
MKPVTRSELLDYQTYGEQRPQLRASAMKAKDARRIHLGQHLTFLFENADTVRYQVQEMKFPHLLHGAWKLVVARPKIDEGRRFQFQVS